jgi:hypothetical protein
MITTYVLELEYVTMRDVMSLVSPLYDIRGNSCIVLCEDGVTYEEVKNEDMRGRKWIYSNLDTWLAEILIELANESVIDFKPTIRDVIRFIRVVYVSDIASGIRDVERESQRWM